MTIFDWVLLCISVPWAALMLIAFVGVVLDPRMEVDPKFLFYVPFIMLLFVAYRVWG